MRDLRSAKTTMQILKVHKGNPEYLSRIEEFLENIEFYVTHIAQTRFERKPSTIGRTD